MTLQFKYIKPGTLIIRKKYCLFKRLWYKLRKKELPYNRAILFLDDTSIMDYYTGTNKPTLIAEPKKIYSKEDVKILKEAIDDYSLYIEGDFAPEFYLGTETELAKVINTVRPNTLQGKSNFTDLIDSKDYNVKQLAKEKNWDICLY